MSNELFDLAAGLARDQAKQAKILSALDALYKASIDALTPELKRSNPNAHDTLHRAIIRANNELRAHRTIR